jgi:hypothetical protein
MALDARSLPLSMKLKLTWQCFGHEGAGHPGGIYRNHALHAFLTAVIAKKDGQPEGYS